MLRFGEARALDKIHDRNRNAPKLFAGAASGFDITTCKLGMSRKLLSRVTLHEGKVERPPGEAQERHPDQHALQEKSQQRNPAIEDRLQHGNVDPALMIREHKIVTVVIQ